MESNKDFSGVKAETAATILELALMKKSVAGPDFLQKLHEEEKSLLESGEELESWV